MMTVFAVVFALIILGQIFLFKKTPTTQPKTDAAPSVTEQRDDNAIGHAGIGDLGGSSASR